MRVLAHRFTRRRLIASSAAAGAPLVLAACGQTTDADDDRSEEDDPELLNAILEQHLAVEDAAKAAADGPLPNVTSDLASQRKDSISQLESFISERSAATAAASSVTKRCTAWR